MNKVHISLTILGLFITWKCQAFEYILDPRVAAGQRYDTNITLQPTPKQGNWVSTLSPGFDFGFYRENSEFKSNFTWNHLFYNNQSELDFDEQLLSTNFKHLGEKINWGLNASYNSRSSLNTEATQSGLLNVQVRRRDITIDPSVTYALDNKNTVSLEYNFYDVSFQKNTNFNLNDYTTHSVTATLSHLYTEKDSLSLIFSSSLFESQGQEVSSPLQRIFVTDQFGFLVDVVDTNRSSKSDQNSLSHTAQIGWRHTFTEQFVASLTAGARYTEAEQITTITGQDKSFATGTITPFESTTKTKSSGIGQVFNASLQKSFERGSMSFNAYQQLTPTVQGNQQQTFLGVNSSYNLSERWITSLSGSYTTYESSTKQQTNTQLQSSINRTYYAITPSISWKWTPEVDLSLSYTYRQLSFSTENQARDGNIAQIQFTYQPQLNRQVK